MIFEKYLLPDEYLDHYYSLTPEHVKSLGKKYIFSDVDNTLVTYDDAYPTLEVAEWCSAMAENGVTIVFVSNNKGDRINKFNEFLRYPAIVDAKKPFTKKLRGMMNSLGANVEESLFLGDQLLTDAACAKTMGMYCVIVPPIKDKTSLFFRFKRWIEIPYMKKYRKIRGIK